MKDIIVQGFPYDEKSSFLKGTRHAPPKIREVYNSYSSNYYSENLTNTDSDQVIDKGDFKVADYFEIESVTAKHLSLCDRIVTLGGDHSITYPVVSI